MKLRPEIIKFATVGASSTIIDFALLTVFVRFGLGLFFAVFLSYLIGSINGYLLNNRWTFAHLNKPSTFSGFLRYAAISFVGLGLTELIIYVLYSGLHVGVTYDKIVSVVVVFFWNYLANRHFTFRELVA